MTEHISNLEIKSYRGVSELLLQDLGAVNILVGDNNSGKTSVLEVLESVEAPDDYQLWKKIAQRGQQFFTRSTAYDNLSLLANANDDEGKIEYSYQLDGVATQVSINIHTVDVERTKTELAEMGVMIQSFSTSSGKEQANMLIPDLKQLSMDFRINGRQTECFTTYNVAGSGSRQAGSTMASPLDVTYVSPVQHADERFFLSKIFNRPAMYQEMLEVLKAFDPSIMSINADRTGNEYSGRVVYKILSKDNAVALPLSVYGDGMKKAILLMSAAVATANGILLIDEFETAIHTSAMSQVYRWILSTCHKLNIQLFMTTHSQEALDKLLENSGDLLPNIRVIRLKKKNGKTMSRTLSGTEALEDRKTYNMELRT